MRLGLGLGLGAPQRLAGWPAETSVFDGGTIEAYSGPDPDNAGDRLASGTFPSAAFGPWLGPLGTRTRTVSLSVTLNGTVQGLLLRNVGDTVRAWIDVVSGAAVGDTVGLDHVDVQIGNGISVSLEWDSMPHAAPTTGFTQISDRSFSLRGDHALGVGEANWDDIEGTFPNFQIVSDPRSRVTRKLTGRMFFPKDMAGGFSPATAQLNLNEAALYKRLIVRYFLSISSSWCGHSTRTNKIFFYEMGAGVGGRVFDRLWGSGTEDLEYRIALQNVDPLEIRTHLAANIGGPIIIPRGHQHKTKIEAEFVANTPNALDGIVKVWINGTLRIDYSDVGILQTGEAAAYWNQVKWDPIYGGGGGIVPADMDQRIDHHTTFAKVA
jgi:hypothetical protein